MDSDKNTTKYDDNVRELVLTRLEMLPSGAVISIGSGQELTKEKLIQSVREGSDVGQKIIEIEMSFLQGLKDGVLYGGTSTNN
ncbi:MAG: hypothetical protein AUJ39_01950 [Parcubacteria group bacterium CG1_02_42_13]|nr:MAG: hypothetical protein AUJ39_01950 [Parcubacteria group bacterium CG1_02_42_13]